MEVRETVRSALRSLVSHPLRTALTALGMVIGVAAVVAVIAVGEGAKASVEASIRELGSNLLFISPSSPRRGGVRSGNSQTLTREDAVALSRLPGVRAVAPQMSGTAQIRYLDENIPAGVLGVTGAYMSVRSVDVELGIGISDNDDHRRARVAVIGAGIREELFGGRRVLGERVQVRGVAFRVIGVLRASGALTGTDDQVFVPMSTHQGVLFGLPSLSSVSVQLDREDQSAAMQARIEELLRLRHRLRPDADDDFRVRSQAEILETLGSITAVFTAMLGSVAAVSLLVGGIGIMNIMLVSVRERTREIGVRMAVGARRRDILLQFLVEAVVVSLVGGLAGLILGYLAAIGVARLGEWPVIVPGYAVALALGVSVAIGLVFGVSPARRAARLDPVEALRHD